MIHLLLCKKSIGTKVENICKYNKQLSFSMNASFPIFICSWYMIANFTLSHYCHCYFFSEMHLETLSLFVTVISTKCQCYYFHLLLMSFETYAIITLSEMPLIIWSLFITIVIYCCWCHLFDMPILLYLNCQCFPCQKCH